MSVPDITIVGLGIRAGEHLSRQTEEALQRCQEVLFVDTNVATQAVLERLCPKVTSLFETTYAAGDNRLGAYRAMAAQVIEAALDHAPVAFAMQGHPIVFSYAPFLISDLAQPLGLSVQVLPGISSLDELFAQLMIDPCRSGLQMYEATDLLLRKRPLQADVPLVIWQVGNLETRLHTTAVSRPERFTRFVAHLGQFYPASHPVTLFFASPHPLMRSTVRTLPLGALPSAAAALHPGITLVLPPIQERAIADPELARLVDDPAHLARITRG